VGATGATGATGVISSASAGSDAPQIFAAIGPYLGIGPGASVTITSTSQHVLVQTSASVGFSGQMQFGIGYVGPQTSAPQTYILDYDGNSAPASMETSAIFTGLSPGTYTFSFFFYNDLNFTLYGVQTTAIVL
jgi:hypothetical protein